MSYNDRLTDLERDGERSLTEQIVTAISEAISSGELVPAEKLPPTRELAEVAGVNHLTAVRAYKRLRELGLVSSRSGRAPSSATPPPPHSPARRTRWHRVAALRPPVDHRQPRRPGDGRDVPPFEGPGTDPLSVGYPSAELFPYEAIRRALGDSLERHDSRALQYTDIAGLPELVEQLAALSELRGAPEDPGDLVVTTGARQGLTLAARAVLRPGDAVACEAPTFMGVIESVKSMGTRVIPVPWTRMGSTSTPSRGSSGASRSASWRSSRAATTQPGSTSRPSAGGGCWSSPGGTGSSSSRMGSTAISDSTASGFPACARTATAT